jgi:hypothetical protein
MERWVAGLFMCFLILPMTSGFPGSTPTLGCHSCHPLRTPGCSLEPRLHFLVDICRVLHGWGAQQSIYAPFGISEIDNA